MEEVAQAYSDSRIRNKLVNDDMILAVYKHLVDRSKPGTEFDKFVTIVHQKLTERALLSPIDPELQEIDQKAFGRLGVALMHACSVKGNYLEGYNVLHVLHKHGITYATCGEGFGMDVLTRTSSRIAITASSICLNLNPPQVSGALEVLRGSNYALPCKENDRLSSFERSDRADLLNRLVRLLMNREQFDEAYDLLSRTDYVSGLPDGARDFLNELLLLYSQNDLVDKAVDVYMFMEKLQFSREPTSFRAVLNCVGRANRTTFARQLFWTGCLNGIYPRTHNNSAPLRMEIPSNLTTFEIQLLVEKHLNGLREHPRLSLRPNALSHTGNRDPLTIIVKSVPEETSKTESELREAVLQTREKVIEVLTENLNPPLAYLDDNLAQEVMKVKFLYFLRTVLSSLKGRRHDLISRIQFLMVPKIG